MKALDMLLSYVKAVRHSFSPITFSKPKRDKLEIDILFVVHCTILYHYILKKDYLDDFVFIRILFKNLLNV